MIQSAFLSLYVATLPFLSDEPANLPTMTLKNGATITAINDHAVEIIHPGWSKENLRTTLNLEPITRNEMLRGSWIGNPLIAARRQSNTNIAPFKVSNTDQIQLRLRVIDEFVKENIINRKKIEYINLRSSELTSQLMQAKSHDEFAATLNHAFDQLRVSHFRYFADNDPGFNELRSFVDRNADLIGGPNIGASLRKLDEGTFVVAMLARKTADAEEDPLLAGDHLVEIDGKPFAMDQLKYFKDKLVRVKVERAPGQFEMVRRRVRWTQSFEPYVDDILLTGKIEPHENIRVGYCRIWWMFRPEIYSAVFAGMHYVSDADVIIIDLRGGWGGNPSLYLDLIERQKELIIGDKPLILLVDEYSRSAKEWFAFEVKRNELGLLVGHKTAGAMLGMTSTLIGNDALLMVPADEIGSEQKIIEGNGVAPDIEVPFDFRFAQGKDPIFERAKKEAVRLHQQQAAGK